jgi:hypothetical protein
MNITKEKARVFASTNTSEGMKVIGYVIGGMVKVMSYSVMEIHTWANLRMAA